jgi:hypothetical protein
MERCVIALQPTALQTAGSFWRRARIAWHRLVSAISDPYRPERYYMRGPGPKCRERQDRVPDGQLPDTPTTAVMNKQAGPGKGVSHKYCPKCTTLMVLERVMPAFGPLPELRSYKCLRCGCVIDEDVER